MKKIVSLCMCFLLALTFFGCKQDEINEIDLSEGTYYMTGDFEDLMIPYMSLNFEDNSFAFGAGQLVSFAENGSFTVKDGMLIATSQTTKYIFRIKDSKTLVLLDNGNNEFFSMPENAEFVHIRD